MEELWVACVDSIRSDEGLTLETSAFETLYGGQFTLSTQLIKPTYLIIKYAILWREIVKQKTTNHNIHRIFFYFDYWTRNWENPIGILRM